MPVERSAGIIFFKNIPEGRKYLVLHSSREPGSKRPEHWDFPKGLLDKGEDGISAAKREAKEEVGFEDFEIIVEFKETAQYFKKQEGKTILKFVAMFLARTGDDKVKLSWEHDKYEWLSFAEAYRRITYKPLKNVLKKADEFLQRQGS